MKNKKRDYVLPIMFALGALSFGFGALIYSFIGETNDYGDFIVVKSHMVVMVGLALISAVLSVVFFFPKKK